MIAVDTSALMAILLDEPEAAACAEAFATNDRIVISAATVAEALIVAERRGIGAEMADLSIDSISKFQTSRWPWRGGSPIPARDGVKVSTLPG